jgi:hypothetical protein
LPRDGNVSTASSFSHPSNEGHWTKVDETPNTFLVLLFPDSSEFRWVHRAPRPGSRIRSRAGDVWTVSEVLRSGVDTYTVFCAVPREGLGGVRELAADLFARARETIRLHDPREERRRR